MGIKVEIIVPPLYSPSLRSTGYSNHFVPKCTVKSGNAAHVPGSSFDVDRVGPGHEYYSASWDSAGAIGIHAQHVMRFCTLKIG